MSLLAVVRHGQASFLAQNYDKLSTTGEHQSALLGRYWVENGVPFTHVFYGPAQRQIRTGEIVADQFRTAGLPWPEPVVDPDFDEFPAEEIFRKLLPVLLSRHPHLAEQMALFEKGTDMLVRQRVFDSVPVP